MTSETLAAVVAIAFATASPLAEGLTRTLVTMTTQRGFVDISYYLDVSRNAIHWCARTIPFFRGCSWMSPACDFCYAVLQAAANITMQLRLGRVSQYARLVLFNKSRWEWSGLVEPSGLGHWLAPFQTEQRWLAFTNSMSDPFHESLTDEQVLLFFRVMHLAKWHQFQVLTKRHVRMQRFTSRLYFGQGGHLYLSQTALPWDEQAELPNVWLGVTVENQKWADIRIPELIKVRAAVRFLSIEPLLGPVDLSLFIKNIEWVIVGGESGKNFREMKTEWVRMVRDLCVQSSTAFFFKQQAGANPVLLPDDLDGVRWREFPRCDLLPIATRPLRRQMRDWVRTEYGRVFGEDQTQRGSSK